MVATDPPCTTLDGCELPEPTSCSPEPPVTSGGARHPPLGCRGAPHARRPQHPAPEALAADLGAHAVSADLTDRDTLRSLIRDVEQAHGPVDVLVNNAGTETVGHLTHLSADDLEHLLALNLLAPVELCRQVLPWA